MILWRDPRLASRLARSPWGVKRMRYAVDVETTTGFRATTDVVESITFRGIRPTARTYAVPYRTVRNLARSLGIHLTPGKRRDASLAHRNAEMRALRSQQWSLKQIGERYALTRERVRQILHRTGGDPLSGATAELSASEAGPPSTSFP